MIERVRAILVTRDGELLTIRRDRPGIPTYSVLPGGHVEPTDASLEAALAREIREELAGEPHIRRLVHIIDSDTDRQYFYLATIDAWAFEQRSGPEFAAADRGRYELEPIPFTSSAVAGCNLKPDAIATFLSDVLSDGDPFALPDLRPGREGRCH
jgi:ADP-ribose pyrophosphatase YjhB (NUDIX family)